MTLAQLHEHTPDWLNYTVIGGSWIVSLLQPLALLVTVIWTALQIYGWFEKRFPKPHRRKSCVSF